MDNIDHLAIKKVEGSSPNRNNRGDKTAGVNSLLEGVGAYKNVNRIINPPPPLPGVFIFDRPTQPMNISQVDSNFNHSSKSLGSTYSQNINHYPESTPPDSYNKDSYNEPPLSDIHTEQCVFQGSTLNMFDYSLSHEEKGLKSLQPSVPSSADELLPSDGNVYQSLQPVPHNLFDVSPSTDSKVYQQLHAVPHNDYRLDTNTSSKFYDHLNHLPVDGNRLQKEEAKTYQQLKPLNPLEETKTFQQLRPVVPAFDHPQYANSKLYQQLRQPINRDVRANYQPESKIYHQLRPVTVNDFEQVRQSHSNQTSRHSYTSGHVKISTPVTSNSYTQLQKIDQVNQLQYHVNQTANGNISGRSLSVPPVLDNNRRSPLDLKHKGLNKTPPGGFQTNKPKIYLEPRDSPIRHTGTMPTNQPVSMMNDPHYCGPVPKFDTHVVSASYEESHHSLHSQSSSHISNSKPDAFRLPGPYEFNLPQSNVSNKYRLPKILGPNEYSSAQEVVKSPENHQMNHINPSLKHFNDTRFSTVNPSFTNTYAKHNVPVEKSNKIPLSLPKSPVCYGDSSVSNNSVGSYSHGTSSFPRNDQVSLFKGSTGLVLSTNSAFENQSVVTVLKPKLNNVSFNILPPTDSKPAEVTMKTFFYDNSDICSFKEKNQLEKTPDLICKNGNNTVTCETRSEKLPSIKPYETTQPLSLCCTNVNKKYLVANSPKTLSPEEYDEELKEVTNLVETLTKKSDNNYTDTKVEENNLSPKLTSVIEVTDDKVCKSLIFESVEDNQSINECLEEEINNSTLDQPVLHSKVVAQNCEKDSTDIILEPPPQFRNDQTEPTKDEDKSTPTSCSTLLEQESNDSSKTEETVETETKFTPPEDSPLIITNNECSEKDVIADKDNDSKVKEPIQTASDDHQILKCITKKYRKRKSHQHVDEAVTEDSKQNVRDCKIESKNGVQPDNDSVTSFKEDNEPTDLTDNKPKKRKYKKRTILKPRGPYKKRGAHKKRGPYKKRKIKPEENRTVLKDNCVVKESVILSNDEGTVRKKRKYTKRAIKKELINEDVNNEVIRTKRKYTKRKHLHTEHCVEMPTKRSYRHCSTIRPVVKLELVDPLEEGLISDDEGEVVFLGFDIPDEEDDTILGFDLSPGRDDSDPFNNNKWMPKSLKL